jgi:hypothetical protein
MYDRFDLKWEGDHLRLISGRLLATIERDQTWPTMWRVRRLPHGHVTDIVNLSRARDAATTLALASLNRPIGRPRDQCSPILAPRGLSSTGRALSQP